MKLELDLNALLGMEYDADGEAIGKRDLRSEVVQSAAETLLREIRQEANREVREVFTATVEAEVRKVVQAALALPIQQTTQWGEKKGGPTTVLEIVRTKLEEFLSSPNSRRDGYNREPGNLTQVIEDAVRHVMTKELQAEIDAVRKQINTQIQEHALKAAAESLTKNLTV